MHPRLAVDRTGEGVATGGAKAVTSFLGKAAAAGGHHLNVETERNMLLTDDESKLFFKLHRTLMFFVNKRLRVIPQKLSTPEEFAALSPEVRVKVRDALNSHLELIESFADENPAHFSDDELEIVRSGRHLVHGKFYVFRELKKYTVFLSTTSPAVTYGVLALSQPFEDLIGPYLPVLTETVLLPFKGMTGDATASDYDAQ